MRYFFLNLLFIEESNKNIQSSTRIKKRYDTFVAK
jgi:hypothetical protein